MRDLPRYDRSKDTPLMQTLRAFAIGQFIGCVISAFVTMNFLLILVGIGVFMLTAFVGGIIEGAQESR